MNIQYLFFIVAAILIFLGIKGGEKRSLWLILGFAFAAGGALPFFRLTVETTYFIIAGVFVVLAVGDYIRRGFVITSQQKIWILMAAIFVAMNFIQ